MENILVEVTRGDLVESIHRGTIVICDHNGKMIAYLGNKDLKTYIRSAAKPIQAIPLAESGALEKYNFTDCELAVIAASHSGEKIHEEAVESVLKKINLTKEYLKCGFNIPLNQKRKTELLEKGEKPACIYNGCSGKHAGMLALAVFRGETLDNYHLLNHPVQQSMLEVISDFSKVSKDEIVIGIDGCGVPVFGLPILAMAGAYARLGNPTCFNEKRQKACKRVTEAMMNCPELVAGSDRFTTKLMEHYGKRIIAKDGSEAVFCLSIPEKDLAVAIKIEDGSDRALAPVVLRVLEELRILTDKDKEALKEYYTPLVKNFRGETVGEIRPVFKLNFV